ncbi:MAG: metallophosphoesterase [Desulfovibrio sp.]|nr:metallophosphoesterase [Desulfovibrio sp.]MBI4961294.1 metallophosphoesterase [Desulfovibrio sp.]
MRHVERMAGRLAGLLAFAALVCLAAFSPALAAGEAGEQTGKVWSFVLLGDTRDVTKKSATGISAGLADLAGHIAAEPVKPDLVIHAGDLTNGYWLKAPSPLLKLDPTVRYREMYRNFLEATAPIREAGIAMYYVRGNHEFGGEINPGAGVPELIAAYGELFAARMPQNGPEDSKGLNYSFTHKSANFIVTDQYTGSQGRSVRINLPWIKGQLESGQSPVTFVLGHSPAFTTSVSEEYEFQLAAVADRDPFWQALTAHKVKAYLCCHEHFYARGAVDGIWQVVQGNGGASPMTYDPKAQDKRLTNIFPHKRVPAKEMLRGYMVITVDETTGTVTAQEKCVKDGKMVVTDSFTM